jgi:hypothetical protein
VEIRIVEGPPEPVAVGAPEDASEGEPVDEPADDD